jgi:hypothetical protein
MQRRVKVLRGLVMDSSYTVDAEQVAGAIIARARARHLVPETAFRNDVLPAEPALGGHGIEGSRATAVRSFRPSRGARSFRLTAPRRQRDADHAVALAARA